MFLGRSARCAQLSNAFQDKTFSLQSRDDWLQGGATFSQQSQRGGLHRP